MKKIVYSALLMAVAFVAKAQVSTEPPSNINPDDSLKIIVNLDQLDGTQEYVQNLIADADAGLDIYIWTWKPVEHPAGHPLVNGVGGSPWKNSNDTLVMKKEAEHVYSYKMVPTDFYGCDAALVYKEDIHFLVKPKDGGGYGDPDRKSGDLKVAVDPPATERDPVYGFPTAIAEDDILTIVYENDRETKTSMQNLDADSAYVHAECKLVSGTVVKYPPNYFDDPSGYPAAKMTLVDADENIFNHYMVPREYFNLSATEEIDEIKIVIRKPEWQGGAERVDDDLIIIVKCP